MRKATCDYPWNESVKTDSLYEMICMAEAEVPDRAIFKFRQGKDNIVEITNKELKMSVDAMYLAFNEMGAESTHIAIIGPSSYKWLLTYVSGLCSENVVVPVDKDLPESDLIYVINHSDAEYVFCATKKHEDFFKEHRADFPNIKKFVSFEKEEDEGDFLSFDKFFESGKAALETNEKRPYIHTEVDKLKLLVYTSGTTGKAKGVMLSERNITSCCCYGLMISDIEGVCLSVLPYHHTYEAVIGIWVAIHRHNTICINENLKTVVGNLKLYKPDYLLLVPAFVESFYSKIWSTIREQKKEKLFKLLIKMSNFMLKLGIDRRKELFGSVHKVFGGNLQKIVCGGAPIRKEVADFFESIGVALLNGYGITECSPLVSVNRDYFNDPATVGVKLPCIDVKIDDINEDGNGEICVKGPTVMLGYYKNEEATAESIIDGWFHTGDFGMINEHKQIIITGRKKNLIVLSNGKNIYPEEIEDYIQAIDEVAEVVVYSPKDEHGIQKTLCAEVFLLEEISHEELCKKIKNALSQLPAYKQVSEVIIRKEEFEKTTSRKIKRAQYNA
ncbi:MAG: AMP-binding protein [Clostridia bacterium]|nr:AMP-binding protein [Clostridia bacterium]